MTRHLIVIQLHSQVRVPVYHRLSIVVMMTSRVNGKAGNLTPVDLKKTLKILLQKIGYIDYVAGGGATRMPNFMGFVAYSNKKAVLSQR